MFGAFEGGEDVIDDLGDFGGGCDLACAGPAVCGKGCLGDDDPVAVSELGDLLVDGVLPSADLRVACTSERCDGGGGGQDGLEEFHA